MPVEDVQVKRERDDGNGNSSSDDGDDVGPMPMPAPAAPTHKKRKKSLPFEASYLANLPSAAMYERSYMHRDIVTHVVVAPETHFVVTASQDGHVKFWKKMTKGIEFVKHYKAHLSEILALEVSKDGLRLCSTSSDQNIKFYDILGFDMVNMIHVPSFTPTVCCWIHQKGAIDARIVVADQEKPILRVFSADQTTCEPLYVMDKTHTAPVAVLGFNEVFNCVISGDVRGHLEYWNTETFKFPTSKTSFKFKGETDLYDLAKCKTYATSIDISPKGDCFVLSCQDAQIRVFRFQTGKLRRKYDESLQVFEDAQANQQLHLDEIDFGRRAAVEKELMANPKVTSNCVFDESGFFILYPTLLGIKMVNLETNQLVRVLGKVENSDRFLKIALFQGKPKVNSQLERQLNVSKGMKKDILLMSDDNKPVVTDPTLFCTSFKRNRFFLFSSREPEEDDDEGEGGGDGSTGRDVFNEKPTLEETQIVAETSLPTKKMGDTAILHTTMGDVTIKLYAKECPRTIENFCTHAREGYYDNVIFHRVIKNFMVQTGDPLGDGTGGESIWGGEFEDEFHRNLRHDRAFTVSMANAGPGTNGSQFFITTVPTPWLDNKHTVFGRVESGKDTVSAMEQVRTDKNDKPIKEIKIINIDIF